MKKVKLFLGLVLAVSLLSQSIFAQGDIITAKELAKIIKNPELVIVSARKPSDYSKVHIKNAVNINHKDLYQKGDIEGLLKDPAEIAKEFGAKGITEKSKIVIYDNGSCKYSARLYWIFKYLGATDVKILSGHMDAWKKARKPVTKNPTKVKAKTFNVKLDKSVFAEMKDVKKPGITLVDVRPLDEFNGTSVKHKSVGHIPGAIQLEFKNFVNPNGTVKSKDQIAAIAKKAGLSADKEIILYCATSIRAGIVFLALKSILGYENVKVYEGALNEWKTVASNKIEK